MAGMSPTLIERLRRASVEHGTDRHLLKEAARALEQQDTRIKELEASIEEWKMS